MAQFMKRIFILVLCLLFFTSSFTMSSMGDQDWPSGPSVQAEGAILMDADTGTILWGKNIHNEYYPASITKIMTALLVIENCALDETVTFSHNAVFNVESGSSSAGINEGDKLSVKDCLYALLLKSANESANALAEHVAGSTEAFADMMNDRAKELGCINTHFSNPSGLNDPDHYTSSYDMSLIARAAFHNPVFIEIDSTAYYKLPPNASNKDGLVIYPKHNMMRKSTPYYYPGVIGGKTGYTSLAGNTLVTYGEKNGLKLITVILKGSKPLYWTDTKNLLDFGFENFVSLKAADYEKTYSSVTSDLNFSGLSITRPEALILDPDSRIILPETAHFTDAQAELSYDISSDDPPNAIAKINYRYNERVVGSTYLKVNDALFQKKEAEFRSPTPSQADTFLESGEALEPEAAKTSGKPSGKPPEKETEDYRAKALRPFKIPVTAWMIAGSVGVIALTGCGVAIFINRKRRNKQNLLARREQRMKRLRDSGISADEFNSILEQRRSSYSSKRKSWWRGRFK